MHFHEVGSNEICKVTVMKSRSIKISADPCGFNFYLRTTNQNKIHVDLQFL